MANTRVYYGVYDGQVCNVNDPENRGRIQCVIPDVTEDSPSAWCEPCIPFASDDKGDFYLPNLKDYVWVMFEHGDPNYPVYFGGWFAQDRTPLLRDYADNKLNQRIIGFFNSFITMMKEENKIKIGVTKDDPEIVITEGHVAIKGASGAGLVDDVLVNNESVVEDKIAKVVVPTKTSDITNDSNFVADSNYVHTDNNFTNSDKDKLNNLVGDKFYVYTQSVPSDTWVVTHNLNKNPSIEVVDSAGTVVIGDYEYIDANTVRLVFGGAFSGKAYFN